MTVRGQRVLVKLAPSAAMQRTESGLILEHAMTPAVCYGKVMQVGDKCADVQSDDLIAFSASAGDVVDGFPTPHLIVNESDVLFVVERTA